MKSPAAKAGLLFTSDKLIFSSLISESPNAHAEEYHCESKQDSRFGQNIAQAAAAQDEVQHALHRPAGWEDLYRVLYRRWE